MFIDDLLNLLLPKKSKTTTRKVINYSGEINHGHVQTCYNPTKSTMFVDPSSYQKQKSRIKIDQHNSNTVSNVHRVPVQQIAKPHVNYHQSYRNIETEEGGFHY